MQPGNLAKSAALTIEPRSRRLSGQSRAAATDRFHSSAGTNGRSRAKVLDRGGRIA
jgi:hypothetical protein